MCATRETSGRRFDLLLADLESTTTTFGNTINYIMNQQNAEHTGDGGRHNNNNKQQPIIINYDARRTTCTAYCCSCVLLHCTYPGRTENAAVPITQKRVATIDETERDRHIPVSLFRFFQFLEEFEIPRNNHGLPGRCLLHDLDGLWWGLWCLLWCLWWMCMGGWVLIGC